MPRPTPRISLLKLAEYLDATAVRRRAIVRAQHSPPDQIVPQYRRATAAAVSFLRKGGTDVGRLERAIATLQSRAPTSEWDSRDLQNSAHALEHLMALAPELELGHRRLGRRRQMGVMSLAGVDISVRPHVRLWKTDDGTTWVGAVKLCFSKTRELPEVEALRAATIMRRYLDVALENTGIKADHHMCQVVDVFRQSIYSAPAAYKRTMAEVHAACEEIRSVWPGPDLRDFPQGYPPAPAA